MLKSSQMIPAIAVRGADGHTVHSWDFKQKKNIVVVFLRQEEPATKQYVEKLLGCGGDLEELEARALVVLDSLPVKEMQVGLPENLSLASDVTGRAQREYLGEEAYGPRGLELVGVFVADRFGELFAGWVKQSATELPGVREVLSVLHQIEMACEECGSPHWPAD
jgi:hypothetical protein